MKPKTQLLLMTLLGAIPWGFLGTALNPTLGLCGLLLQAFGLGIGLGALFPPKKS